MLQSKERVADWIKKKKTRAHKKPMLTARNLLQGKGHTEIENKVIEKATKKKKKREKERYHTNRNKKERITIFISEIDFRNSYHGSAETNQTSIHEDAGLNPGHTQVG